MSIPKDKAAKNFSKLDSSSESSSQSTLLSGLGSRSGLETWLDQGFINLTKLFAIAIIALLMWISLQVTIAAWPAIQAKGIHFIHESAWDPVRDDYGVLPMIYGTLTSSLLALCCAMPLGVGTAIFLSEDFLPIPLRKTFIFLVELLAAIPSVVYGLWGIFVLIPALRPLGTWLHSTLGWIPFFKVENTYAGPGLLPAAVILTIMILPIITTIAQDSLAALPVELRQASIGLGATRWQTIFKVLLPSASSGIVGGAMLGLGRAMGETMAVTLVIGNSNDFSASILNPANTISSLLANQFAEADGLQISSLMYAGLILFGLTLIVNIFAQLIVKQMTKI